MENLFRYFLSPCAFMFFLLQGNLICLAGEFHYQSEERSVEFGVVDLHPKGDSLTINALNGATQSASSSRSVVSGGKSGKLILKSKEARDIFIQYPDKITLRGKNGNSITLEKIRDYSQYATEKISSPGDNKPVSINIGGTLVLPAGTPDGEYYGSLPVIIAPDPK